MKKTYLCVGLAVTLLTLFSVAKATVNKGGKVQSATINVKTFGAKGDGTTDDYNALLSMCRFVNSKGGGSVFFPKGTYYIASYHTASNKVANIEFVNCNNLTITGDHAVISVNGNFKRTNDFNRSTYLYSNTNAIIPLSFSNCNNLKIAGLELNGNVDKMSRDPNVTEGSGLLLKISECNDVTISNMYIHHAQTDGIYITGNKPSTNVTVSNIISTNNARQGMSVINLYNGRFTNCKFINTGLTGSYGNHAPSAGVDVEPVKVLGKKTGHIIFDNCVFANNLGSQFVCTSPKLTSGITLSQCTLTASAQSSAYTLILAADSVLIDRCNIDCNKGSVYPRWQNMVGSNVEISHSTIKSSGNGLIGITHSDGDQLNIHDNEITCTKTSALTTYFPYLAVKNMVFSNNKIFIPAGIFKPGQVTSFVQYGASAKGNVFYTDKAGVKPNVSYRSTVVVADK